MAAVYRRGDKGQAVREIQGLLNSKAGKLVLTADGDFGSNTEKAVKAFQETHKLKVDGVVGARTWEELHRQALGPKTNNFFPSSDTFSLRDLEKFFASMFNEAQQGIAGAVASVPKPANPGISQPKPAVAKPAASAQAAQATPRPKVVKRTDLNDYQRVSFPGHDGRGYVINDFRRFVGHAIQLPKEGCWKGQILEPGEAIPKGFKNECVSYVRYFGLPYTKSWRKGPRVCDLKPGELLEGTVVATLRDGGYHSDYSGRSHVGIYLKHDDYSTYLSSKSAAAGVRIMDQYNGRAIGADTKYYAVDADAYGNPTKKWDDKSGVSHDRRVSWTKDGEEYYVVLTML